MDYIEQAKEWAGWDPCAETSAQVGEMIASGDAKELEKTFGSRIAFGTAGLRAEMGPGPSRINDLVIIQTAQGLCEYLFQVLGREETEKRGVALGYDHRCRGALNSRNFAELTAAVCISNGIKVYLFDKIVATPMVPFAVDLYNCAAGVMVTASHNPKNDNGYKVYWGNGCQIIPPHDSGIAKCIVENLHPKKVYSELISDLRSNELCLNPYDEVISSYFKSCGEKLCRYKSDNTKSELKIVYTAMHGVGTEFTRQSFEAFGLPAFVKVNEQCSPDPTFPTVEYPNPEEGEGALKLSFETAEANGATLVLANDPDADRLAVAEKQQDGEWKVFTGNEIGALLAHWQFVNYKGDVKKLAMVASTVSSKLIGAMAKAEGFLFEETLTGFKWMGNRSVELRKLGYDVVFSYEEAIGFCVGDLVKDKDGVCAAAVFAEMANQLKLKGMTCSEHLQKGIFGKYGHFVSNNHYIISPDPVVNKGIFDRIRNNCRYLFSCGEGKYIVTGVRDLLKPGFDSSTADHKPTMPVSSSNMITFNFDNGVVLTLRMSGTEPKLKFYSEMSGSDPEKTRKALDEFIEIAVKNDLLKA